MFKKQGNLPQKFKRIGIRQANNSGVAGVIRQAQEDGLIIVQKHDKDVAIIVSYDERGLLSLADFVEIQGSFLKALQDFNFELDVYTFIDAFATAVEVAKGKKKFITVYSGEDLETAQPEKLLINWDNSEEIFDEETPKPQIKIRRNRITEKSLVKTNKRKKRD